MHAASDSSATIGRFSPSFLAAVNTEFTQLSSSILGSRLSQIDCLASEINNRVELNIVPSSQHRTNNCSSPGFRASADGDSPNFRTVGGAPADIAVLDFVANSGRGATLGVVNPLVEPGKDDAAIFIRDGGLKSRIVTNQEASMVLGSRGSLNCGNNKQTIGTTSDAASPHTQTRWRSAADCRCSNLQASAASAITIVDLMTISQAGKLINARIYDGTSASSFI